MPTKTQKKCHRKQEAEEERTIYYIKGNDILSVPYNRVCFLHNFKSITWHTWLYAREVIDKYIKETYSIIRNR